ncbi:peptide transporter (plasmid) [Paraburkholderia sp. PREW-6R]|uniref:peptide transporter n=1 Tax=Paraburkholderia sp. PREW-6R TaxID=3141544 RepID=UPI0031F5467F
MSFRLEEFEYAVYNRQHEQAGRALVGLLHAIDSQYGQMAGQFEATAQSAQAADAIDEHLLARLVAAVTTLATDPAFQFSDSGFATTLNLHRWLSAMFAASPFRNGDHILRSLGQQAPGIEPFSVENAKLRKFEIFYFPESEIPVDVDGLWEHDRKLTAGLALALMSPRFLGTPAAHSKRETLLRWLPERLAQVELDDLPGGILHDVYMHCSYADYPRKHDIKRPLNELIRRKLHAHGLDDLRHPARAPENGKPVLAVVLEWFTAGHSIYRTHSLTMEGMRKHFHVIGLGYAAQVDETGRAVFDEFVELKSGNVWDDIAHIRDLCVDRDVQVLYMPSVGMFPLTMLQSNLRVAPLQLMALGHPATSHSTVMDYVVVEEDYLGDPACFSEELLVLPPDGMPYRAPEGMKGLTLSRTRDESEETVRIAVAATTMKLNPQFLSTCARIANEASVPVQFHFLVGQAVGLILPQVRRLVHSFLGDRAVVYAHQSYGQYMQVLADCDLFVNPFPFGNTNGIVDAVFAGMVGICRTGPEVHEHIDEGMFSRLGFPSWMVTTDQDSYVKAALRLVNDRQERLELREKYSGPKAIEHVIFAGRKHILGERIHDLWMQRSTTA